MRVLTAYRDVLRPHLIMDSFLKVGQLPDNNDFFESKFSSCKINIPLQVYNHLKLKFPECVQEFLDHGKLSESFMDEIDVPKDNESSDRRTVPKDQRVLYQQRTCILNHVEVKAFYDAYEQKKIDAPLLRAEKQNQKKAEIDEKKRIAAVKKAACDEKKRIAAEKKAENDKLKRIAADEKAKQKQIAAEKKVERDELNDYLRHMALHSDLQKQIDYTDSPEAVSSDFVGSRAAGVVDGLATVATGKKNCVVYVWYDNEFGYSCQVIRMLQHVTNTGLPAFPVED